MKVFLIIIAVLFIILMVFAVVFLMAIWRAILGYTDVAGKLGVVAKGVDTKLNSLDNSMGLNSTKVDENTRAIREQIRKQQEE